MKRVLLLAPLAIFLLSACGSASYRGSVVEDPMTAPDFALTDQSGQAFRLGDQRGKVILLFFGYTSCPDVCPTTLGTWRKVHQGLSNDADRVEFLFVTVDPERDTPERLGMHVQAFNPDFVGLTGTPEELEAIYDFFGVIHEKDTSSGSALGYLVNHTATTFILDPEGKWRLRETYGTEAEDFIHDIQQLLD